jgi:hypothetical protein
MDFFPKCDVGFYGLYTAAACNIQGAASVWWWFRWRV